MLRVAQIIVHPGYSSSTFDNDISLLKLSETVSFTLYIQPVCLAAPGSTFYTDVSTWVTGWGAIASGGGFDRRISVPSACWIPCSKTSSPPFCFSLVALPAPQNLMEVVVPIRGNRECNCDYGVGKITDNMICAGLSSGGKDSCQVIISTGFLSHNLDLRKML